MPLFTYIQLHHDRSRAVGVVGGTLVEQVASGLEGSKDDGVFAEHVEVYDVACRGISTSTMGYSYHG